MADTICVSSPTLTSTQVTTSHVLFTSLRTSVTTLPGSVITSLFTTCAVSPNTTICSTSTSLTTQRAVTSTQIVTLTSTVDTPVTTLATLYGSSCRTVSNTDPYPPSTDSTPSETSTPSTSTITTTSYSTFTGTSLVTSEGTTFTSTYTSVSFTIPVSPSSDGQLHTTASTSTTSTLPALTPDPLQTNQANPPASGNNTAAIVGGTLGGIAALALLALLTWHMIKKSHRFDNLFKDDDTNYYGPPPKTPPINPYQYGLVGQQETQPIGFSPPGSPGLRHANLVNEMGILNNPSGNDAGVLHTDSSRPLGMGSYGNEMGMQGGSTSNEIAYNAPNQAPAHHVRNPSTVPLLVGAVSGHTRPNTGSSRASVASSDPLGPLVTHASPPQNTGYPPPQFNSYPPALAVYAQQQAIGQAPVQPQQNLGHHFSIGNSAAILSSAAGSSSPPNLVPVGAGSVLRRPTNTTQQPQLVHSQRYEDPFSRTGSPVAYQEHQVLRVRNAETSSMFAEGSSSTFGTPGLSLSGASATQDGKGRPLNVGGEKAPLVYLDGGAYVDPPRTPAPPAYRE